jgi:hypothetical protein
MRISVTIEWNHTKHLSYFAFSVINI